MTKVFLSDVSLIKNPADYTHLLSDYRILKIGNIKDEKKKRNSALCEIMLAKYLGRKPKYLVDSHGKPYGEDVFFSFSHSGDISLCAVSDKEIGADVEKIRNVNLNIAKRFCKSEFEFINNSPDKTDAFFEIWTKKESVLKASGLGIGGGLDSFCVFKKDGLFMYDKIPGYKICAFSYETPKFEVFG